MGRAVLDVLCRGRGGVVVEKLLPEACVAERYGGEVLAAAAPASRCMERYLGRNAMTGLERLLGEQPASSESALRVMCR